MILLLRPLLLKKVRMIFLGYEHEDARDMYDHCLRSARTNVRLLIHLQSRGLLGKQP